MRRPVAALLVPLVLSAAASAPSAVLAASGATTRISVPTGGAQANAPSAFADVSADGRYVAFQSVASTLVDGDTNNVSDVFVRDREAGTTTRVSVSSAGAQGTAASDSATISHDGRWVAFASAAPNLVAGDTNGVRDAFVHDRATGATTRVSVLASGGQLSAPSFAPRISGDGRYVVLFTFADMTGSGASAGSVSTYRVDRTTGQVDAVCLRWDGLLLRSCAAPTISYDGRYVAFETAGALVADDTNGLADVYVRDMVDGATRRVSVPAAGGQAAGASSAPAISADGRFVAFTSAAPLVAGDANGARDVYLRDTASGTTERVSVGVAGADANGESVTRALNMANRSLSADGRYVVFQSFASNLVDGDTNGASDVFVRDRAAGTTAIASLTWDDLQSTAGIDGSISADGRFVTFSSAASTLVAGDTNGVTDIFIRDLRPGPPPTTYRDHRSEMTLAVQLDPEAPDAGRVTWTVPGLGTYAIEALAGMRRVSHATVLITFSGPAALETSTGTATVDVELRVRLDPGRHIAEGSLSDAEGRRSRLVARP